MPRSGIVLRLERSFSAILEDPARTRGRRRRKKNGGAKLCFAPPCPAQPERIRTRAAPHEPTVTRRPAKALRSPSPGRAVAGKRSRTRVPDRVATSSLLLRTRRVPVPSGPTVQALRESCERRFPTNLRRGSVRPLGLGARSTWTPSPPRSMRARFRGVMRDGGRQGGRTASLRARPLVFARCGSSGSLSLAGALDGVPPGGAASRARRADPGREQDGWLPTWRLVQNGSQESGVPLR
jgi:hypothetical protein